MGLALPGIISLLVVGHAAYASASPYGETEKTQYNRYSGLSPFSNDAYALSPSPQVTSKQYSPYNSLGDAVPIVSSNPNNPYLPQNRIIVTYSRNPQREPSFDDLMQGLPNQSGTSSGNQLILQPQAQNQRNSLYNLPGGNDSESTLIETVVANDSPNDVHVAPRLAVDLPRISQTALNAPVETRYAPPPTQRMNSQYYPSPKQKIDSALARARRRYYQNFAASLPPTWSMLFSRREVYGIRVQGQDIYIDTPAIIKLGKKSNPPVKYQDYFTLPKNARKDNEEDRLWRVLAG